MTWSRGLAITVVVVAAAANLFILGEILYILIGMYLKRSDMSLLTVAVAPGLAVVTSSVLSWIIASMQLRKASAERLDALGWGALAGLASTLVSFGALTWLITTGWGRSILGSVLIILSAGLLSGLGLLSAMMCRYRGRE